MAGGQTQLNDDEELDEEDLFAEIELDGQQDSSDGYIMNQYDDYIRHPQSSDTTTNSSSAATGYWKANHHPNRGNQQVSSKQHRSQQMSRDPNYRHFDPYSIYSEDEDVWYSEERLFEVSFFK